MKHKILIIEDDKFQCALIEKLITSRFDYDLEMTTNGKDALQLLKKTNNIMLIIMDLGLPDVPGMELLDIIKQQHPAIPVIILTGNDNIEDAVTALKAGAIDFLNKPPEIERLTVSINNALKINNLSREVSRLRREQTGTLRFQDIIGYEHGLSDATHIGRKAAKSDIPVLISGETGVGKELFARAIHGESHRASAPFIAVNCGAIPQQLVESILFGHEKGSFTGATEKTAGKFREANGGTIFLDEVGELPLETQVKLLRVLQQKEVESVGGNTAIPINVRVISATNQQLSKEIKAGRFREDLFFRLDGLPIHIPKLSARKADIPFLSDYFLEHFSAQENLPLKNLSDDALNLLTKQNWPGNIRELQHLLHRAVVLNDQTTLTKENILAVMNSYTPQEENKATDTTQTIPIIFPDGTITPLAAIEKQAIKMIMTHHNNNITKSYRSLEIAKSTFYRKWEKYGGGEKTEQDI